MRPATTAWREASCRAAPRPVQGVVGRALSGWLQWTLVSAATSAAGNVPA